MNELNNIQVVMRGFEKQRDNSVVPFESFQLSRCEVEVEMRAVRVKQNNQVVS